MHSLYRSISLRNPLWLLTFLFGWLALLPLGVVRAQTGPGGVGNGAGPGLRNILWLDAASLGLSDGDAVGTWTDRSGNSHNATRTNAAQQPRYTTSVLNGRPVVRFDGSDDEMNLNTAIGTNSDGIVNRDYSFIFVGARRTTASNDGWFLYGSGAFDGQSNLYFGWRDGASSAFRFSQFGSTEMQVNSGDYINNGVNQYAIFTGTFGQTEAIPRKLYENGDMVGTNPSTQVLTSYAGAELAGLRSSVDIAEVIFYQGDLNEAHVVILNNYLSAKYDLSLVGFDGTNRDFYAGDTPINGNFDYDVAGIGRQNGGDHRNASSDGLTLSADASVLQDGEFLMAGHDDTPHGTTTANLPTNVQERWARSWFVDKTGNLSANLTFDLQAVHPGETFNGDADRYVLLRWDGATYQEVPISNANKSATATNVTFTVGDSDLVDGIYTIGTQAAVSAPLTGISRRGTGPGGVGNALGTDGQPENAMWLDARAQPYGNGVLVDIWHDQSGNSNHATQSSYSRRPALRTDIPNVNGNPTLRFDGSNDFMDIDGSLLVGTDYTVIAVGAQRNNSGFARRIVGGGSGTSNNNFSLQWKGTDELMVSHLGNGFDNRGSLSSDGITATAVGTFGFLMGDYNSALNNESGLYLNGKKLRSYDMPQLVSNNNSRIARMFNFYQEIDVAELIIYPTALNSVQRTIVNNYLSAKYDIPLLNPDTDNRDVYAGDNAANGHHDFGVIGVGQQDGHRHLQANGRGLALTAQAPSLSNDEFVLVGHNDAKPEGTTANVGVGIAERLTRTWYVDKTGSVDASLTFELQEILTKHTFSTQASDYVLLRRNGATFEEVPGTTAQLSNDHLTFELTDAQLTNGVYTIGTRSATATPIAGFAVPEVTEFCEYRANFNDGQLPGFLEEGNFNPGKPTTITYTNGYAEWGTESNNDRRKYIRTKDASLFDNSLLFEVTARTPASTSHRASSTPFVGLGSGNVNTSASQEPEHPILGMNYRLDGGLRNIYFHDKTPGDSYPTDEKYKTPNSLDEIVRFRITWNATTQKALLEADYRYTGTFVADAHRVYDGSDNGFNLTNMAVYFGGGKGIVFDDFLLQVDCDTDNDGVNNTADLDSDNDGIVDTDECLPQVQPLSVGSTLTAPPIDRNLTAYELNAIDSQDGIATFFNADDSFSPTTCATPGDVSA
ncbi:MAG: hypothetical protein WA958_20055, partial [Tunicatimonas sp.]